VEVLGGEGEGERDGIDREVDQGESKCSEGRRSDWWECEESGTMMSVCFPLSLERRGLAGRQARVDSKS